MSSGSGNRITVPLARQRLVGLAGGHGRTYPAVVVVDGTASLTYTRAAAPGYYRHVVVWVDGNGTAHVFSVEDDAVAPTPVVEYVPATVDWCRVPRERVIVKRWRRGAATVTQLSQLTTVVRAVQRQASDARESVFADPVQLWRLARWGDACLPTLQEATARFVAGPGEHGNDDTVYTWALFSVAMQGADLVELCRWLLRNRARVAPPPATFTPPDARLMPQQVRLRDGTVVERAGLPGYDPVRSPYVTRLPFETALTAAAAIARQRRCHPRDLLLLDRGEALVADADVLQHAARQAYQVDDGRMAEDCRCVRQAVDRLHPDDRAWLGEYIVPLGEFAVFKAHVAADARAALMEPLPGVPDFAALDPRYTPPCVQRLVRPGTNEAVCELRNPHRLQVAALAAVLFADPLAAVSRLTMANHERARQREMATPIRAGRAPRLSSCFQMRAVNVVHFETDCVGCWQRIKANAADDVETLTPVVATWMAHHREIELTD
jgi:hypothetical protein